jgi:hypothetical protein
LCAGPAAYAERLCQRAFSLVTFFGQAKKVTNKTCRRQKNYTYIKITIKQLTPAAAPHNFLTTHRTNASLGLGADICQQQEAIAALMLLSILPGKCFFIIFTR